MKSIDGEYDKLIDGYVSEVLAGDISIEQALDSIYCYIEEKKDKQIDELKRELSRLKNVKKTPRKYYLFE